MKFLRVARQAKFLVITNVIVSKVLNIKQEIMKITTDFTKRAALQKFAASKGWENKFEKLDALRSAALHGQGLSVCLITVAGEITKLQEVLMDTTSDRILTYTNPVFCSSSNPSGLTSLKMKTKNLFETSRPRLQKIRSFATSVIMRMDSIKL